LTKELWLNLPVRDVRKSKEFFTQIGFTLNTGFPENDEAASILIGEKNTVVMLFPESTFQKFTGNGLVDTTQGTEVLISIDAESKEAVDALLQKVVDAGGTIYGEPQDQGWMYGAGFADLDGHRWNVLYMDQSQMPKSELV